MPADIYDVKKLRGLKDTYRVRIGDLRLIYEVLWDAREIHILVLEGRESAY